MEYPMFDKMDLNNSSQDGDPQISQFIDFLKEIKDREMFYHPSEAGIVAYVITNGTNTPV